MGKALPDLCIIKAPAKINLHLEIGIKRGDGFHELESLIAPLDLGDTLKFEVRTGLDPGSSQLSVNWESLPEEFIAPEKNLVLKALALFRQRTGFSSALNIRLDKRIPSGSGLGGGSSDAASTLIALDLLAGTALSPEKLGEMAAILGSDVPFFLKGGAAFARGRGELLEPVKVPQGLWLVIAKPPFPSDTAAAYRLLDQAREGAFGGNSGERAAKKKLSFGALIQALGEAPETWPFRNDFLPLFLENKEGEQGRKAVVYISILEALRKGGALFSGLSGSGSSCFGVFSAKEAAEKTEKELAGQGNYARLTFFLAQKADPVLEYSA
ncbi:MAG: 4-(cytidine 5'-diphospho)-2-C-methyl-D-erythritol kinase [Treponema sp.]|nr:4-(cytidine 5'-diphospho)-2-C-methyl-D-erythritol kinase [Treponema sp.]